jgi:hypothetical protein
MVQKINFGTRQEDDLVTAESVTYTLSEKDYCTPRKPRRKSFFAPEQPNHRKSWNFLELDPGLVEKVRNYACD